MKIYGYVLQNKFTGEFLYRNNQKQSDLTKDQPRVYSKREYAEQALKRTVWPHLEIKQITLEVHNDLLS